MTDSNPPTYAQLMRDLQARGVDSTLIAQRLGCKSNSIHFFKKRDRADPGDPRYQRLFRLARACRKAYGGSAAL